MTGKKVTVIDELNINGSGLYAFMPFERLDKNKKAVFKIGLATKSFERRVEQYHTYLPKGVYMVAFLENPPIPRKLRSKDKETPTKQHYTVIEKFILKYIDDNGGKRIYSTARVRNPNDTGEGETEWTYTNEETIHNAFREAQKKFSGNLKLFYLEGYNPETKKTESINEIARVNESKNPHYTGKIIFHY